MPAQRVPCTATLSPKIGAVARALLSTQHHGTLDGIMGQQLFMSELRAAPEGICCEHLVQPTVKHNYYISHGPGSAPGRDGALGSGGTECGAAPQDPH